MKPITVHHQDTLEAHADTSLPDPHQDIFSTTVIGFWTYLMTDCLVFATLFATYAIMHNITFGGPSSHDIFHLDTAFIETMILLCSSVTCGFAILSSLKNAKNQVIIWLLATFVLGASFIVMELHEFYELVQAGHGWDKSAFLSSFFTLVGTHGLHVSFGLLWLLVTACQIAYFDINTVTFRRLVLFGLFWHFLDLVWIFIFTFVYLLGVI